MSSPKMTVLLELLRWDRLVLCCSVCCRLLELCCCGTSAVRMLLVSSKVMSLEMVSVPLSSRIL